MASKGHECFAWRSRPMKAAAALLKMGGDKEATHHIFTAIAHMEGPTTERMFKNFAKSEHGAEILIERRDLRDALMDRERLESLPDGTLGRAYLDFMDAEGLSAAGFEEEMAKSGERFDKAGPDRRRFLYRVRHMHDLLHVLTGYGRDPVGEFCVLALTSEAATAEGAHHGTRIRRRGVELIVQGHRRAARALKDVPVKECVAEARTLGRDALIRADLHWEEFLGMSLERVRDRCRIGRPDLYLSHKEHLSARDAAWREANAAA